MSGPWEQFQSAAPTKPLEVTVTPQRQDFGIDFNQPKERVREQIAALPEPDRKPAMDAWADHFVTNESRPLKGVENVVGAMARGTPVGSWLDEAAAGVNQAAHSLSRGQMGAPYDEAVAYHRARARQFDKENPKTSMALQLGTAVATAPFTPGIRAVQGVSLLGKAANAGLTGLVYGTGYGSGLGESGAGRVEEAAKGGALGLGLGAVAAPVAAGVSNGTKYLMDLYRGIPQQLQGTSRAAIEKVSRAMDADGLYSANGGPVGVGSYQDKVRGLGREGMLADMGDNLLMQVQGITTQPGKGQSILKTAINDRAKGASGRIKATTDEVLGPAENLIEKERAVSRAYNAQAKPLYDEFYSTPVKVTENLYGVLDRAHAAGALSNARSKMARDGFDPTEMFYKGYPNSGVNNSALNARFLDYVKREIDDLAGQAVRSGSRNDARIYTKIADDLRNEVDAILSPNNPSGSIWARARSTAGDGLQYREALEEGSKAFSRGTHPDQMAADLAGMSDIARVGYQEGARGQIRDVMGNAATSYGENGAAAARRLLGSENAKDKLRMVIDPPSRGPVAPPPPNANPSGVRRANGDDLIARLDAESTFANTKNTAWQGTQTAARAAAQKEFPSAASKNEFADKLGGKSVSGAGMEVLYRSFNALMGGALDARNSRISVDAARMLAAQGARRDEIAAALMSYGRGRALSAQQRDKLEGLITKLVGSSRQEAINRASEQDASRRQ